MLGYFHHNVSEWLECSPEGYYPMALIDYVHTKIHRKRSVDTMVREDNIREVLGIFNKPTKSALGWGEMLNALYECNRKSGIHQNRQRGYIKNCNNRTSETVTTVHQKR